MFTLQCMYTDMTSIIALTEAYRQIVFFQIATARFSFFFFF